MQAIKEHRNTGAFLIHLFTDTNRINGKGINNGGIYTYQHTGRV